MEVEDRNILQQFHVLMVCIRPCVKAETCFCKDTTMFLHRDTINRFLDNHRSKVVDFKISTCPIEVWFVKQTLSEQITFDFNFVICC